MNVKFIKLTKPSREIAEYQKAGYREIGRIPDFTYWNDKMWQDIRMEKYL
jgi:hypothetical protein